MTTELESIVTGLKIALADKPEHLKAFNHVLHQLAQCLISMDETTIERNIDDNMYRRIMPAYELSQSIYNLSESQSQVKPASPVSQGFNEVMAKREWLDRLSLDEWSAEMHKRMNPTH